MSFYVIFLLFLSIILFLLLIVSHEFGHFLLAKKFGVKVNEFSIGMGPILFSKHIGETFYSFRLLPLGGFCSLEGEEIKNKLRKRTFASLTLFKKTAVIIAGPLMNIFVAIIFMIIILGQKSQFASTTISNLYGNSTICTNNLCVNDKIVAINNYKTFTFTDISFAIATNKCDTIDCTVIRNNSKLKLNLSKSDKNIEIGFSVKPINKNFSNFFSQVFKEIFSIIRITYRSLWLLLTGKLDFSNISGPVGIVSNVTNAAYDGLKSSFLVALNNVIYIIMILSVNLGIVNLIPFPALDGGRLLLFLLEAVRKKAIKQKTEETINKLGIYLLIFFAILITIKDLFSLFF